MDNITPMQHPLNKKNPKHFPPLLQERGKMAWLVVKPGKLMGVR